MLPLPDVEFPVHARHVLANVAAGVPEYVAFPHCVHASVPEVVLYSPCLHSAHVPPFKPVYPGLHAHAVLMILAIGDELYSGQLLHVELAVAPVAAENWFARQSVHARAVPVVALYLPDPHAVQAAPFTVFVYPRMHVQAASALLPAPDEVNDGQVKHVPASAVAPTEVEYFPAPQSVHVAGVGPVAVLYFPARHSVHVPPFDPVAPALQVQLVTSELPATRLLEFVGQAVHTPASAVAPVAVEYLPGTQFVHTADPVSGLYVPGTQNSHGPPFGPEDPALQVQSAAAVDRAGEFERAVQPTHAEAPRTSLYVPAGHSLKTVLPARPEYPTFAMQAVIEVLPAANVELPVGHAVAAVIPILFAYVPATAWVQGAPSPSAPKYPILHLQLVTKLLPVDVVTRFPVHATH